MFLDTLQKEQMRQLYRACVNLASSERSKGRGPYKVDWVADILEWAASNLMPLDKEEFAKLPLDKVFSLPGFNEDVHAVAFSCRGMLENIKEAKRCRPEWINLMVDGTYKLDYIKWTLISVGTTTLRWDTISRDLCTQFRPFGYCFARVECESNITLLLDGLRTAAENCFDIALDDSWVKVGNSEKSVRIL